MNMKSFFTWQTILYLAITYLLIPVFGVALFFTGGGHGNMEFATLAGVALLIFTFPTSILLIAVFILSNTVPCDGPIAIAVLAAIPLINLLLVKWLLRMWKNRSNKRMKVTSL